MTNIAGGKGSGRRALVPGTVLNNNYRIIEQIGEGGMGSVFRAANIFMEEDHVAIKVIRAEQADDDLFKQMFGKEVKAMLKLSNPRLVAYRTFAHDPELDLSFVVTEFIDGPSLKSITGTKPFSPQELLGLMTELAIGLRAAHKAGVVHRDLAPDNVLLEDGDIDRPKIIDFGIVKDTAGDGTTIIGTGFAGKYGFVAPEQLGEPDYPIGPWTDIFSLGLIIAGLAQGKSIDMGNTPGAAIRRRQELPDLSALPEPMQPLISQMLATHPEDRIRSADEVLERADSVLAELGCWSGSEEDDDERTVIKPTANISVSNMEPNSSGDDDEETTEVQIAREVEGGDGVPASAALTSPSEGLVEEEIDDYLNEEETSSHRSGAVWILLGLIAAGSLAVVGGVMLGDYASVPGNQGEENPQPITTITPSNSPTPTQTSTEPIAPPTAILPQVAISTSLAPDAPRTSISPETWVTQQDLPRQMYGSETVGGVIAAYLTVAADGEVSGCAIGGSSQVEPQRMLNASATSVCRALQANARFEPLSEQIPPSPPISPSAQLEVEAVEAAEPDDGEPIPEPSPTATETLPPPDDSQVFVRVAFRTIDPPPDDGSSE